MFSQDKRTDVPTYIFDLYQAMQNQNIIMVYEGEMNQTITTTFTAIAERDIEASTDLEYPIYRRLYHVMVESLQNVCKHSNDSEFSISKKSNKFGTGIFIVTEKDKVFHVVTGNDIANDKIEAMSKQLDEINSLDKLELKKLYIDKMKASRISDKGGAGLGFIDIVKKTGNKLDYSFQKISEEHSFFILKSCISQ